MKWSIVTIFWLMVFAVFLASNSHAVVYTNAKITPVPQKISTSNFSIPHIGGVAGCCDNA